MWEIKKVTRHNSGGRAAGEKESKTAAQSARHTDVTWVQRVRFSYLTAAAPRENRVMNPHLRAAFWAARWETSSTGRGWPLQRILPLMPCL